MVSTGFIVTLPVLSTVETTHATQEVGTAMHVRQVAMGVAATIIAQTTATGTHVTKRMARVRHVNLDSMGVNVGYLSNQLQRQRLSHGRRNLILV